MDKKIYCLDNGILRLSIAEDAQWMKIEDASGTLWESRDLVTFLYGSCIRLDAVRCGEVEMMQKDDEIAFSVSRLVWMARFPGHGYLKPDPAPEMRFTFKLRLEKDEVLFITEPPEGLDNETSELWFPGTPLLWNTAEKCHFAGAWNSLGTCAFFPSSERYTSDYAGILPVAGCFGEKGGTGIRTAECIDYRLRIMINNRPGTGSATLVHTFDKGKSEYTRTVRMKFFGPGSSYVDLAKWHRESVKRENRFKSLDEKAAQSPEVEKLYGSVIWKHNTFACEVPTGVRKDYSLYVSTPEAAEAEGRPNNWSAKEVFDTAHAAGFDRVCIFNTGWNNKGFDSGYPTRFPPNPERGSEAEFTAAAEYGRSLSEDFIFSVHDNYRDVYPNSEEFDFEEIIRTIDGGKLKGGIWRGGRCYIICCKESLKYARRDLKHIGEMCGRGAIYLDVQGCTGLNHCYHPGHPGSRKDDAMWRIETFREAKKHIGAVATEGAPHEFAVQDVDMGAYPPIDRCVGTNMRPIPFFQLVYHDSVLTFCGQGVSGTHGTDYVNRVALYGMLPWDFGADSLRISKELREACHAEMVKHEFLSDHVEHTVFANGSEVFANFGKDEELGVPAGSFVIR
jgi:hypothetical protein